MPTKPANMRSCKLGTIPSIVVVHGSDVGRIRPDETIRVRERDGSPWQRVLVRSVNPDGYFQADR